MSEKPSEWIKYTDYVPNQYELFLTVEDDDGRRWVTTGSGNGHQFHDWGGEFDEIENGEYKVVAYMPYPEYHFDGLRIFGVSECWKKPEDETPPTTRRVLGLFEEGGYLRIGVFIFEEEDGHIEQYLNIMPDIYCKTSEAIFLWCSFPDVFYE